MRSNEPPSPPPPSPLPPSSPSRDVATDFEQGKSVARLTVEGQSYNFKTDSKESGVILASSRVIVFPFARGNCEMRRS